MKTIAQKRGHDAEPVEIFRCGPAAMSAVCSRLDVALVFSSGPKGHRMICCKAKHEVEV